MTEERTADLIHGRVKWFDATKGFGFIVSETGGPDILLHANVLRNFGQNTVSDGTKIEIRVQQTARGAQAVEVLTIEAPEVGRPALLEVAATTNVEEIALISYEPARVKWFDKGKGFGFANVFGSTEDVFLHIEVLRSSGLADLAPGEAVCLKIISGKRGRMAVQVSSWDTAARQ